jgi:putative Holliday junction resolvase
LPQTILAFDFGLRRIGVAVGQDVTASASPLGVVSNGPDGVDHPRIRELIDEWQPSRLVVGLPTNADGTDSDITSAARAFARELGCHDVPVETIDERYSSIEAERALKDARQKGSRGRISKEDVDAAAAVMIAERFLSLIENNAK